MVAEIAAVGGKAFSVGADVTRSDEVAAADSEYGVLRDVLLGPPETIRRIDNAGFSSVVRDTERKGKELDSQLAPAAY